MAVKWVEKRLDELGSLARGRSRHRPRDAAHLYGGPYPFIQTGDVKHSGLYITSFSQTYSEAGLQQSKLWPAGTLCITIAANIADTSILAFEACFPDSIIGFTPYEGKSDARFIKYLFDAILKKRYENLSKGVAQDNLSHEKILSIEFRVPNPSKQTAIADIISAYDEAIENNRRRIQLLEEAARQIYDEWFVRFRFPGHERVKTVDGIPAGWEKDTVGNATRYISRGISPTYSDNGSSVVINQKCIRNNFLSLGLARLQSKDVPTEKVLQIGDVLINSTGEGTLGRVAQCWNTFDKLTSDSHVTIVRPKSEISPSWFGRTILRMQPFLATLGKGATNQTELSKQAISGIEIIKPDSSTQDKFESFCYNTVMLQQSLNNQNHKLAQARDLLLPRLMNGEITV